MRFSRKPDATLWEPWDDATYADIGRLQSYLNIRLARGELDGDGSCLLDVQAVSLVTRTGHVTRARKRLLSLPERSGVGMSVSPETRCGQQCVRVRWPKFVAYQTRHTKFAAAGTEAATRAPDEPIQSNPIQSNPFLSNGEPAHKSETVDLRALPVVEKFVDALHREEARRKLAATRVSALVTRRLQELATRIADWDLAAWETRAVNAVERRVRSRSDDAAGAWSGPDVAAVALRLDQLASSPGWSDPKRDDEPAVSDPDDPTSVANTLRMLNARKGGGS